MKNGGPAGRLGNRFYYRRRTGTHYAFRKYRAPDNNIKLDDQILDVSPLPFCKPFPGAWPAETFEPFIYGPPLPIGKPTSATDKDEQGLNIDAHVSIAFRQIPRSRFPFSGRSAAKYCKSPMPFGKYTSWAAAEAAWVLPPIRAYFATTFLT